ncbi:MAG: allophanate hydrolase [Gammaproteobacteria bacterium]|nr:allophanate hydrolase [Gammaproteobacteria bacterium]
MNIAMNRDMSISGLHKAYREGSITPAQVLAAIRRQAAACEQHNIWIYLLSESEQAAYLAGLEALSPDTAPLWGIPFAIKDNIHLAGIPTTAGCEAFTQCPDEHARVVARLIEAGAIPVGKTNLDQFATGLNGTRSPYGACKNSFNPEYISGGSSSGSAVAVALGLASFSLGTDTAGSGRVPAGLNNLVGTKPTLGLLSSTGLIPACRSLDTISIFTYNADDANRVLGVAEGFDADDAYSRANTFDNSARHYGAAESRLTLAVIAEEQLAFFGDQAYQRAYESTLTTLHHAGFTLREIDYAPFLEAARLLYEGPWVSERYLSALPLVKDHPDAIFPVVRGIIEQGATPTATALFEAQYALKSLHRQCRQLLEDCDALLTPTAGRHYTIEEMLDNPVEYNSALGYYTNFMNLLDFAAVSVPTQITGPGLPFGVTLVGEHFTDRKLLSIANRMQQIFPLPMGATGRQQPCLSRDGVQFSDRIEVVVCGAHLKSQPLNWQLTERGAEFVSRTTTAPAYRFYALADGKRPGLVRDEARGTAVSVEVWSMPRKNFGSFVAGIPAPLGIGKVELADGRWICGFICEQYAIEHATDITQLGDWRAWLKQSDA